MFGECSVKDLPFKHIKTNTMAKKTKTFKAYKKPFDSSEFSEISKSELKKEIGDSGIEVLETAGKVKTAQAIYKTSK